MISLPDFKEKQMLIVRAEWGARARLSFQNQNIVFSKDGVVVNRISCHRVFAVFVVGDISITTRVMSNAAEYGVSLFFLKNNFDVYGSLVAKADGNYLLRMKQYSLSPEQELAMSKAIVLNKAANQKFLLHERGKGVGFADGVEDRVKILQDNQELLGVEGELSRKFFGEYFSEIDWRRRMPRVKPDVPNFLLDMGYTFLFNFVDALLRLHGFDTYKGVYHKLFFQRKSLTCDIVEPFRCLVDKQLLKAYNLKQVHEKDFLVADGKVVLPFDKNQKYSLIFSEMIMDHKEEIFAFVHGFYRHIMDAKNEMPHFSMDSKIIQ
jgi:CRISPR-associated protein Cas1